MADQRDLHNIEQVVPATFDADIADGHEVRGDRSLKTHSVGANLQVKPYPQSTSFSPGVDGIGGTLRRLN
jgi:hypothetical protein